MSLRSCVSRAVHSVAKEESKGQIQEWANRRSDWTPFFRQVDQILGISERTFAFTRKVALKQKIKVGGKQIGFAVEGGEIQGESLSLTLRNR